MVQVRASQGGRVMPGKEKLRILVLEDEEDQIRDWKESIRFYNREKEFEIEPIFCKTVAQAKDEVKRGAFLGAILDRKIGEDPTGAAQVVDAMKGICVRIPSILFTGLPLQETDTTPYLKAYRKGDVDHSTLLALLVGAHSVGLVDIMGGIGDMEKYMYQVFETLMPQMEHWIRYGQGSSEREKVRKALLRHTMNHMTSVLEVKEAESGFEDCAPEEFYLVLPMQEVDRQHCTGDLVRRQDGKWFVVLNPLCDLVWQRPKPPKPPTPPKAKKILLAEVGPKGGSIKEFHYDLPAVKGLEGVFFDGGVLNFQELMTVPREEFGNPQAEEKFEAPKVRISPPFIKDVTARFARYYGRQGAPVINHNFPASDDDS